MNHDCAGIHNAGEEHAPVADADAPLLHAGKLADSEGWVVGGEPGQCNIDPVPDRPIEAVHVLPAARGESDAPGLAGHVSPSSRIT
jgi:hypothetical protein